MFDVVKTVLAVAIWKLNFKFRAFLLADILFLLMFTSISLPLSY